MPKSLVIVESPAKAKTIQKYLGKNYLVLASKGHVKDLPKRGGVDIDDNFKETYAVIEDKGKADVLKAIKKEAKNVDEVLLATDPDREGEAIAWHIKEELENSNINASIERVLFNEITKKGVKQGIENPRALDTDLYEAQRTRRVLDRIGGYPLSNLLWRKLAFGLSAGRVQTPALRIIVDRQREIDAFVPVKYWIVDAALVGKNRPSFTAVLDAVDGDKLDRVSSKPAVMKEELADTYVSELKAADFKIDKITKRAQKRNAPAPYTTSKLQQDASNRLGMQPKSTMRVAQRLYEGIELGKGKNAEAVGLITYMRTDSVRLSDDAVNECRDFIKKTYGKNTLPDKANVFKTKKQNVQDAHEAIRPTRLDLPPDEVAKWLKAEQLKLYKLIWDRFVASQMLPALYDQTTAEIEAKAKKHVFRLRVSGSVLRVPGWKQVYGVTSTELAGEEDAGSDKVEEGTLPELNEGESLNLVVPPSVQVHAKQTEPPPYFNEASLVKKLEEEGIGRPSTYAEIISKVQARDYVRKIENRLKPTPLGILVIDRLVADEFSLADISFTRKLEDDLDGVAEARVKRLDVLRPFHDALQAKIAKVLENKDKWWPEPEMLDEKCPECEKQLMKRWGRNGPFVGCTGYPECKHTRNIPTGDDEDGGSREPELTPYTCDECSAPMLKRWGRNGYFLGCSKYPECKHTRNLPLGVHCPKCGGEIVQVKGKGRSRAFYGCSNYNSEAKCDFRIWQKPVNQVCPDCKSDFLVPAGGKANPKLKCVREGCDYIGPMPDESADANEKLAPTGTDGKTSES
ncbi:MAG: type I DNA topoisomerase [Myxococcales bacterium]|nr:MAG: type I DNA topoisomerase [Myxococcales bacterium]